MKNDVSKVYEILGLAGSGKSTIKKILSQNEDLKLEIPKEVGVYLITILPRALYIFYKTKNIDFVRGYFRFQYSMKFLESNRDYKNKKLIFDQGPIFLISMLIKEVPSLKEYFLDELKKILIYYDEVIYLEASPEALVERITNREQDHRIKNMNVKEQLKFLNDYTEIFNSILEICKIKSIKINRINTEKNDILSVERLLYGIIQR